MWLFYALIGVSVILALQMENKRIYVYWMFLIFGFLMMFHSPMVGNDTEVYFDFYTRVATEPVWEILGNSRFEVGFILLNKVLTLLWDDPHFLLFVSGAFFAYSYAHFINRYSTLPCLSIIMFICLGFFDLNMSGIRQAWAISILLFSFDMIVRRKPFSFVLLVLCASCFHKTALAFIIAYPLSFIRVSGTIIMLGIVAALGATVVFDKVIINLLLMALPSYYYYFTGDAVGGGLSLGVLMMLTVWGLLFFIGVFYEKNRCDESEAEVIGKSVRNIEKLCILLAIMILLFSMKSSVLDRFKLIISFMIITYFPNAVNDIENRKLKLYMIIFSIIVLMTYTTIIYVFRPEWTSTYPFIGFWNEF